MASVLRTEWIRLAVEEGLQALAGRRFFTKQKPFCPACQCLEIGRGVGPRHSRGRTLVVSDKCHYVHVLLAERGWRQVEKRFSLNFSQLRAGIFVLGSFYVDLLWDGSSLPRVYFICNRVQYLGCGGTRHQFGQPLPVSDERGVRDALFKALSAFEGDLVAALERQQKSKVLTEPEGPFNTLAQDRAEKTKGTLSAEPEPPGLWKTQRTRQPCEELQHNVQAAAPAVSNPDQQLKRWRRRKRKRRRRGAKEEEPLVLIPFGDEVWSQIAAQQLRPPQRKRRRAARLPRAANETECSKDRMEPEENNTKAAVAAGPSTVAPDTKVHQENGIVEDSDESGSEGERPETQRAKLDKLHPCDGDGEDEDMMDTLVNYVELQIGLTEESEAAVYPSLEIAQSDAKNENSLAKDVHDLPRVSQQAPQEAVMDLVDAFVSLDKQETAKPKNLQQTNRSTHSALDIEVPVDVTPRKSIMTSTTSYKSSINHRSKPCKLKPKKAVAINKLPREAMMPVEDNGRGATQGAFNAAKGSTDTSTSRKFATERVESHPWMTNFIKVLTNSSDGKHESTTCKNTTGEEKWTLSVVLDAQETFEVPSSGEDGDGNLSDDRMCDVVPDSEDDDPSLPASSP